MRAGLLRLLLIVATAGPSLAHAAGCMEGARDRDALIQCSKSELVPLENRAAAAQARLLELHAGETATLGRLRESKRAWDSARNAQCALESRLRSGAADNAAALEGERAMLVCIRREFGRRADDLEALLHPRDATAPPPTGEKP